jgi:hypothetical protein
LHFPNQAAHCLRSLYEYTTHQKEVTTYTTSALFGPSTPDCLLIHITKYTHTRRLATDTFLSQSQREKEVAAGFDGGGGLGVGGEGAWMLSAMATDMIDKQQALDEAIVLLDRERKRTQSLTYKCDEAVSSKQRLESDNQELRRLLHEERNADPAAGLEQLGLGNISDVMEAKVRAFPIHHIPPLRLPIRD